MALLEHNTRTAFQEAQQGAENIEGCVSIPETSQADWGTACLDSGTGNCWLVWITDVMGRELWTRDPLGQPISATALVCRAGRISAPGTEWVPFLLSQLYAK